MKSTIVLLAASLGLASAWPTQLTFSKDTEDLKPVRKLVGESIADVLPISRWRKGGPLAHHPPSQIDMSDLTIAQILNGSLYSHHTDPRDGPPEYPPLKKFAFFVNISNESPFKDSIRDENAHVTLLAPDDFALTPPHKRDEHHGPPGHDHGHDGPHHGPDGPHHGPPHHEGPPRNHPMHSPQMLQALVDRSVSAMDEGSDKEERKEKILKIITLILRYHLVDSGAYEAIDLVNNATIASSLADVRIRSEPHLFPYKHLTFNFFSRTRGPTIKAKNGYIYLLSEPLLPPLTPLEDLFVVPFVFSTLTSGLQKVELDEVLSPWVHHGHEDEVSPVVDSLLKELVAEKGHGPVREFTVFAPSNRAFFRLGPKIQAFLFSPFGRHVLKAILEYHIIPDVAFFSDFVSDPSKVSIGSEESVKELPARDHESISELIESGIRGPLHQMFPGEGEIKVRHFQLTTLFNDTKLPVDLYESRRMGKGPVRRDIWVGQGSELPGSRVHVAVNDVVAYKGAAHVIGSLIRPPFAQHPHHHEGHHEHHEEAHFWQFARSLSAKQESGCPGKRTDVWDQLLKV